MRCRQKKPAQRQNAFDSRIARPAKALRYLESKQEMFVSVVNTLLVWAAATSLVLPMRAQVTPDPAPSQENVDDLARRAEALLDSNPAEAATLYKRALAVRPAWAEGWLYRGVALYQSNSFAQATDALRKGIALAPRVGTAWALLGLSEAELDNSEQALADIHKGEELGIGGNPQFERAVRVKAAQILIHASSFDEALGELYPLSTRNDHTPALVQTMGLCALAESEPLESLSADRRSVVDLIGKAAWAAASQHPEEAAAAYRQALEQFPKARGVHYAYGLSLMDTDLGAALAEYKKEIENNPKHWPALLVITSIQIKQAQPDEAIKSLREAMRLAPAKYRWLCHAELGHANLIGGNVGAAIPELETAARLQPSNAQVHYFLSQAYRRSGKSQDAAKESAAFQKLKGQQDPLGVPAYLGFANSR